MLVIAGHHPFSVKARPRSAAVMTVAVYSAVSAGKAAGTENPDELGVLVRLSVDGLAGPRAGCECEPDPGI
jgi:hypothetical protein